MIDLLILMVFVIGLSLAVYHIAQYSTKETTFEQAIEEQRQKREFNIVSSKNEKSSKKPKIKKIKSKKDEHDSSSQSSAKKIAVQTAKKSTNEEAVKLSPVVSQANDEVSNRSFELKQKKNKDKLEGKVDEQIKKDSIKPVLETKSSNNALSTAIRTALVAQPAATKGTQKVSTSSKVAGVTDKPAKGDRPNTSSSKGASINVVNSSKGTSLDANAPKGVSASVNLTKTVSNNTNQIKRSSTNSNQSKGVSANPSKADMTNANPSKGASTNPSKGPSTNAAQSQSMKQTKGSLLANGISKTDGNKSVAIKKISSPLKEKKQEIFTETSSTLLQEQMQIIENQMQPIIEKKKKPKVEEKRSKITNVRDDVLSHVMPVINKSKMNGAEIQMLIETLLNKQQLTGEAAGEWVEKGRIDPVQQMKRQLEETVVKLRDQVEAQETLSAKISELRLDLNGERSRSSGLKKQLDEAGNLMKQKLEVSATEHKDVLVSKIKELKVTMDKEFKIKVVELKQTSKSDTDVKTTQLKTNLQDVEKELQKSRASFNQSEQANQKLEVSMVAAESQLEQVVLSRDELMKTCQIYQQHINDLKDQEMQYGTSETLLNAKIVELQQSSSASEEMNGQLQQQLNNVKEVLNSFDGVRELLSQNQVKLKDTIREKCELENSISNSEKEVVHFGEIVSNQKAQIERLIEEKDCLASQVVRPAAEGQENGDVHPEQINGNNNLSAEYEEKLSSLTKEVSRLKDDLSLQRRKNDEDKDRYDHDTNSAIQILTRLFPTIKVVENLEQVLKQVETSAVSAQTAEVKPQIIEKIVEKLVQDPALSKQLEEFKRENEDLHAQVKSLNSELLEFNKKNSTSENFAARILELEIENKTLDDRVIHYQGVLSNTESLLKTLECSVESEEACWKEKFVQKEELVCQLNADKMNLTLRVAELQTSLDKVKQAEEMDSQLTSLKAKLETNETKLESSEKEKLGLEEKLHKFQELLKSATLSQTINANSPANGVDNHENTN